MSREFPKSAKLSRRSGWKPARLKIIIICEGETERDYFYKFSQQKRNPLVIVEAAGKGGPVRTLIGKVLSKQKEIVRQARKSQDSYEMEFVVWGVPDVDEHLPSMKQMGNWAKPDGSGRTIYIGKREHGKMLRVYEKGRQLGDPESPWNRWEVQFSNRDRVIPFEVLLNPGPYVAGAYACLGWINKEASRIRTITKTAEIGYDALVNHCRNAYGRLLFVMEEVEGSSGAVLDKLRIEGIPKRLQMPDIEMESSGMAESQP